MLALKKKKNPPNNRKTFQPNEQQSTFLQHIVCSLPFTQARKTGAVGGDAEICKQPYLSNMKMGRGGKNTPGLGENRPRVSTRPPGTFQGEQWILEASSSPGCSTWIISGVSLVKRGQAFADTRPIGEPRPELGPLLSSLSLTVSVQHLAQRVLISARVSRCYSNMDNKSLLNGHGSSRVGGKGGRTGCEIPGREAQSVISVSDTLVLAGHANPQPPGLRVHG